MSISPRFKPAVALLWGDRWWIEGRSEAIVFGEMDRAAETLLTAFGGTRPAQLRLIYQPAFLASVAVQCPQGGRATLRAALQDEHPALGREDCAWSFEPIAPGPQHGATLLHYECEAGLLPLVGELHAAGIEIEGAWPLASALNLVPDDWPETGALTVLAVAEHRSLVYRHTPTGLREVETTAGADATALASQAAQQAAARTDTALYIVALDAAGERRAVALTDVDEPAGQQTNWARLAQAARSLSPRHPHQLLVAPRVFNAARWAQTAAVLLLLGSGALAAEQGWLWRQRREANAHRTAEIAELQHAVATLREHEREASGLRTEIAGLRPGPVAGSALLRALGRDLPAAIVLTRVHADRDGFTIEGGVTGSEVAPAAWKGWLAALRTEAQPWRLLEPPLPTADFTLKGTWR